MTKLLLLGISVKFVGKQNNLLFKLLLLFLLFPPYIAGITVIEKIHIKIIDKTQELYGDWIYSLKEGLL